MDLIFKDLKEVEVTEQFLAEYNSLLTQLLEKEVTVSIEEIEEIKTRSASELVLCAFDKDGALRGIVQGSYLHSPPIYMVYINSVVVDKAARGGGIGSKLMQEAEKRFVEKWPKTTKINFTSSPKRGTRNFYERLGYVPRVPENDNETIVYVKNL